MYIILVQKELIQSTNTTVPLKRKKKSKVYQQFIIQSDFL